MSLFEQIEPGTIIAVGNGFYKMIKKFASQHSTKCIMHFKCNAFLVLKELALARAMSSSTGCSDSRYINQHQELISAATSVFISSCQHVNANW